LDHQHKLGADGDVELAEEQVARFRLVGCECCGADLVALAVNAVLKAAFPLKVPRLPPCQISSSA
jgi:hypothetical protein